MEDLTSATAEELQEVVEQASMAKPAARRFYRAIASRGGLVVGGSEEGQTALGYRSPGRGMTPELPDRSQLTSSALLLDPGAAGADASVRVEFDSSRVEIDRRSTGRRFASGPAGRRSASGTGSRRPQR